MSMYVHVCVFKFFSEITEPTEDKVHVGPPRDRGKMYSNDSGQLSFFIVQKPIGQKNNFVPPPPLKRFDGCMFTMIQWANFLAWVPSLDVDSSY